MNECSHSKYNLMVNTKTREGNYRCALCGQLLVFCWACVRDEIAASLKPQPGHVPRHHVHALPACTDVMETGHIMRRSETAKSMGINPR